MGSTWDTTGVGNGLYDVCNVVADNAGHVAVATITVTVANAPPAPPAVPPVARAADKKAPGAPKKLSATLALTKTGAKTARVTLRWVKPTARDLDHVIVVLNLAHAPKTRRTAP